MTFSRWTVSATLAAGLSVMASGALAQAVDVQNPWARATVQGQTATGAFMTLTAPSASKLVSDSIHQLATFAEPSGIHIVIENHGGFSSNGKWLADTIRNANHPLAGTLPDFGNFRISTLDGKPVSYDSYRGVDELMPLATGVSLKPKVWDDAGQESDLDYKRMMKLVLSHGYNGHVGIEHGDKDREWESIVAIREILEGLQKPNALK